VSCSDQSSDKTKQQVFAQIQSNAVSGQNIVNAYRDTTNRFISCIDGRHIREREHLVQEYERHRENVRSRCQSGLESLRALEDKRLGLVRNLEGASSDCKKRKEAMIESRSRLGVSVMGTTK